MIKFFSFLLNLLFPITCASCGKDLPHDDYYRLCQKCHEQIQFIDGLYCQKCGVPLNDGGKHCYNCRNKNTFAFEYARSAVCYDDIAKKLIHKFKFQNKDFLDRIFSKFMTKVLDENTAMKDIDYIVPVPMHWLKKPLRGYNQTELLAKKLSQHINKPVLNCLSRIKMTKAQFNLNREQRIKNLENCFKVKNNACEKIKKKNILLVDDIYTTGTTIEQCAKTLKGSGAKKIFAVTIAA
jgi:ComF family protein